MAWWTDLWGDIVSLFDEVLQVGSDVLNAKEIAQEEWKTLIDKLTTATKDLDDFEDRVKALKSHVIRADIVFKAVDDIRTGALRDFVKGELTDTKNTILGALESVGTLGSAIGNPSKSGIVGGFNKFIALMKGIGVAWQSIAEVVHALQKLETIVDAVTEKVKEIESVILPQTSGKQSGTYTYAKRVR